MSRIALWSTTAASNNSAPPDGWPEGQNASSVNNCAREMMAQIKSSLAFGEFFDDGDDYSRKAANKVKVSGTHTATYHVGRRVLVKHTGGDDYGTISEYSLSSGNAILTIDRDAGSTATFTGTVSQFFRASLSARNIALPRQSSFLVNPSGQLGNVTGDGTSYEVVFAGTPVYDTLGEFSSATYTATYPGRRDFSFGIEFTGLTSAMTAGTVLLRTSNRDYTIFKAHFAAIRNASDQVSVSGTVIGADMDAGDTAKIIANIANGAKVVEIEATSFFSGKMTGV